MTQNFKSRAAGVTSEGTFSPDELVINQEHAGLRTFLSGGAVIQRGTVLGKITTAAATSAVKASGANTGNGTMSAVTVGQPDKVGVYKLRMLTATTFQVEDPDGFQIGLNGATGAAFADDIGFTLTAGGTPFVAGDGFDITVAAGSGKVTTSLTAANDGSQVPYAVSLEDVDVTGGDAPGAVFLIGELNSNKLIFGTGHSLTTVYDVFRTIGITLTTAMPWTNS